MGIINNALLQMKFQFNYSFSVCFDCFRFFNFSYNNILYCQLKNSILHINFGLLFCFFFIINIIAAIIIKQKNLDRRKQKKCLNSTLEMNAKISINTINRTIIVFAWFELNTIQDSCWYIRWKWNNVDLCVYNEKQYLTTESKS